MSVDDEDVAGSASLVDSPPDDNVRQGRLMVRPLHSVVYLSMETKRDLFCLSLIEKQWRNYGCIELDELSFFFISMCGVRVFKLCLQLQSL